MKKKGYTPLMLLTILFTFTGVIMLVLLTFSSTIFYEKPIATQFTLIITPFIAAGTTCIIRKRFFTRND